MRNEIEKYFIENAGSFISLSEGDFNELFTYEPELLQVPAVLYLQNGFSHDNAVLLLTPAELKTILRSSLYNNVN